MNDLNPTSLGPRVSREQVIGAGIAWTARWSLRWIFIGLGAVLLGLVVNQFWSILLPVILALIVTTALQPPVAFLERALKMPAGLASSLVLVGGIALFALVLVLIAPPIAGQVGKIATDASQGLTRIEDWISQSNRINDQQVSSVVGAAQNRLSSSATSIASGVLVGVGALTSAVITLLITLVLTFLFLKDGRRFSPWLRRLTGPRVGPHLLEVSSRAWFALGGFIRTQALVSLIDAVLIGAGLLIVGVPLALPLAILTFFGGFIPIVGAVSIGAISVLVALVSNGLTGAIIILAVIVAVQQLEGNVLTPMLQSKTTNLHAALVLLAVVLGSTLFGIIGAFLAVPALSVAAVVVRYLDELVTTVVSQEQEDGADPPQRPGDRTEDDAVPVGEASARPGQDSPEG